MKQRRSSIIVVLLFFSAFSIPLLTQTRVFSDMSAFAAFITGIFDKAYDKATSQPDRTDRFGETGKINGHRISYRIVIPGIAGLGLIYFLMQNRRLLKWRRRMEVELEKRKQIEGDLRTCIENLDRINRNSPVTSYRFRFSDQWRIDFFSDAVRDITGYAPSYFIGQPVKIFADLIHPEDRERVSGCFESAFQDKNLLVLEYRIIDKDGQVKWVYEKAVGFGDPVPDPVLDTVPSGIEGFIVDITRQKQFEMEKKQAQGMLHSLIDALPDLIYYKDRKGEYIACNTAFANVVGKNPPDVVGKTDYDLFPKALADTLRENDLKMLSRMKPRKNHERMSLPDGRNALYETFRTPFIAMDGKILGLVGVSRDITSVVSTNQDKDDEKTDGT